MSKAIDWEAAIDALQAGRLPCSAGERRMLYLAASLADQAPVSLGEAVTGIDDRNVDLLLRAIRHAAGRREFPREKALARNRHQWPYGLTVTTQLLTPQSRRRGAFCARHCNRDQGIAAGLLRHGGRGG